MTVRDLPTVNAILNSISAVLLVTGFVLVKRRKLLAHRRVMTSALACSAIFLASYLTYHFQVGSVRFQGTGSWRTLYFAILLTHTVLAAAVAPMAITAFVWARAGKIAKHRRLAKVTFPIWLYVSITGVIVYWMLYRMTW